MYLPVCVRYGRQYIQSDPQWKYKAIHKGNTKRYTMEIQMLEATEKYIMIKYKRLIESVTKDKKGRPGMWKLVRL